MADSKLVDYSRLSPNNSGQRTHSVDRITPHCIVGQMSAESLGDWFSKESTQASSTYGIDRDGRVGQYVKECDRPWTSSSASNDNRAITIECASSTEAPYEFRDCVYRKLVDLCVDICERYGKRRLIWFDDRDDALSYELKADEMLLTVHRWFSSTDCPGAWLMERMGGLAESVNARLGNDDPLTSSPKVEKVEKVKDDGPEAFINHVKKMCCEAGMKFGILPSVSIAQACLESGFGTSKLSDHHNLFGMKAIVSDNAWGGSTWEGLPVMIQTTEFDENGRQYEERTLFRAYANDSQSIADHAAYLAGARNGSKLRYDGIIGNTDPEDVARILVRGGYATDPAYPEKIMKLVKEYDLTQYDKHFIELTRMKKKRDKNLVRVSIRDLRIRTGPGTEYESRGFIKPGVYTIRKGRQVDSDGRTWGRLKSGVGWICLDYTEKV